MGLVKGYFHEEICAAVEDSRADEFDCYEARLHSLLSDLDWLESQLVKPVDAWELSVVLSAQQVVKRMMK